MLVTVPVVLFDTLSSMAESMASTIATRFLRLDSTSIQKTLEAFTREHLRTLLSHHDSNPLSEDN